MKKPSRLKNVLFAALSVILFFGLAEGVLRIAGFEYLPDNHPLQVLRDFGRTDFKNLYVFDKDTLWALRPGVMYAHAEKDEYINARGFRGPNVTDHPAEGVLRIACFGDSSTFGMGVLYDQTYTARLEDHLEKMLPGANVEVISAGVIGYTSTQAFNRFLDVKKLEPDFVTVMPGAINEVAKMPYTDAQRIEMARSPGTASRQKLLKSRVAQMVLFMIRKFKKPKAAGKTPRTPLKQFDKDLEHFKTPPNVKSHGYKLVLISPPRRRKIEKQYPQLLEYTHALHEFSRKRHVPLVDAHAEFRKKKYGKESALFRDDYHPNPAGHDLIAQMLAWEIYSEVTGKKEKEKESEAILQSEDTQE